MHPKKKAQIAAAGTAISLAVAAAVLLAPSGPVTVKPGDDVAKAARELKGGSALTFSPGRYSGQITLDGLRGVTLNCRGAVFTGGVVALKLTNFSNVTLNGGEFTGAGMYGLQALSGTGLTLNQPNAHHNGRTGILTGSVDDVTVNGGTACDNLGQHGLYLSQRCRKARITGLEASRNAFSGVQVNCDADRGSDIQLTGLTCDGNQRVGGAAAIQLAYVDGGSVTDCVITNHQGRVGVALFWTTKGVTVDRCRFGASPKMKSCISVDHGSSGVIGSSNQYAVGAKSVERQ